MKILIKLLLIGGGLYLAWRLLPALAIVLGTWAVFTKGFEHNKNINGGWF